MTWPMPVESASGAAAFGCDARADESQVLNRAFCIPVVPSRVTEVPKASAIVTEAKYRNGAG